MLNPGRVLAAPRVVGHAGPVAGGLGNHAVGRRQQQLVPILEARVDQMRGPFGHQPPNGPFHALVSAERKVFVALLARIAQYVAKLREQLAVEGAHGAKAARIDRGPAAPVLDVSTQLAAARIGGHGVAGIAAGTALRLALMKGGGQGGLMLWPLFGGVNQLVGGMALLVISAYLFRKGKPVRYTLIPMCFVILITTLSLLYTIDASLESGDLLITGIGCCVLALEIWLVLEAVTIFRATHRNTL